ncbi:MAG: 23S rRNA (adenine(2503)-C(2))-methyltransferase RlmN [Gemmatimonadota bacterium]
MNLLDLTPDAARTALADFVAEIGEPGYRVEQVTRRLWQNPAPDFASMSELPVAFRSRLSERFRLPRLKLVNRQASTDGTQKFLFELADKQTIETVAIPDRGRMTLCISSQAGCALRCAFCATGLMGFARNLESFEISGQVRELRLLDEPIAATNVVFMGMGEPLLNWPAVDIALSVLNSPTGLGIGARHITVSTVGILPGIEALAARPGQFRLAISIHAPNEELRRQLMPINTRYPLSDVVDAAAAFARRVTFEYVMLGGVNDGPAEARELASLARRCGAFVNLIPLHPGGAGDFKPSTSSSTRGFASLLEELGVEVAVRRSRGTDISAACGQLRVERLRRRPPRPANQNSDVEVAG